MFDLKRRVALLALPGAAVAMIGGAAVAHASTGTQPVNAATNVTQPAETPGAAETPEAAGVETPELGGAADAAGGHDDGAGQNVDHQFNGQE